MRADRQPRRDDVPAPPVPADAEGALPHEFVGDAQHDRVEPVTHRGGRARHAVDALLHDRARAAACRRARRARGGRRRRAAACAASGRSGRWERWRRARERVAAPWPSARVADRAQRLGRVAQQRVRAASRATSAGWFSSWRRRRRRSPAARALRRRARECRRVTTRAPLRRRSRSPKRSNETTRPPARIAKSASMRALRAISRMGVEEITFEQRDEQRRCHEVGGRPGVQRVAVRAQRRVEALHGPHAAPRARRARPPTPAPPPSCRACARSACRAPGRAAADAVRRSPREPRGRRPALCESAGTPVWNVRA